MEFGTRYQLTGQTEAHVRLNWRVVPLNLKAYFLLVPQLLPYFPYNVFRFDSASGSGYTWLREACFTSVLLLSPMIVLAPAGMFMARKNRAVAAFAIAAGVGAAVILTWVLALEWTAIRFAQDFLPMLLLLGAMGFWWLRPREGSRIKVFAYRGVLVATAMCGIIFGMGLVAGARSFGNPDRALRFAYKADLMTARVLHAVGDIGWPRSYLSPRVKYRPFGMDVDQEPPYRPAGIFYPAGSELVLGVWDREVNCVEVESCFEHDVEISVQINKKVAGRFTIKPGWQELTLVEAVGADADSQIAIKMEVVSPEPPRVLWPIRVRTAYFK
jgi:hypothetical protein